MSSPYSKTYKNGEIVIIATNTAMTVITNFTMTDITYP